MIIRQDSSGSWRTVGQCVLEYGGTRPLRVELEDRCGDRMDASLYGSEWTMNLWFLRYASGQTLASGTGTVDNGAVAGSIEMSGTELHRLGVGVRRLPCTFQLASSNGSLSAIVPVMVEFPGDKVHEPGQPLQGIIMRMQDILDELERSVPGLDARIQAHNEDSDAHSALFNRVQPLIDQARKLPALYVDGLDPVALSGSYAQLKNVPERFTPSSHTHPSTDVHRLVTAIPAADTEAELSDGGNYTHAPVSAPVYVLPDVTDDTRTHEIAVDVKFSASALSVEFLDTEGTAVPLLADISPAAGDVYRFLAFWSPLQSAWRVMPTRLA